MLPYRLGLDLRQARTALAWASTGSQFDEWHEAGRSSWRSGMALLQPGQLHGDVTLVLEVRHGDWCDGRRTGVLIDDLRVFAPFN